MSSLGVFLKSKREEKGLSLEEMSQQTRISLRYLAAIEEDRLNDLPGKLYERIFIRAYAELVGVNVDELAREFREIQNTLELRVRPEEEVRSPMLRRAIWGLGLLALVLVAVLFLVKGERETPSKPTEQAAAIPNLVPAKPADSVVTALPVVTKLEPERLGLELEATEENWVRFSGDDKTIFEGILKTGERKSFSAGKKIKLSLGRAWAARVWLNGHPLKKLGKEGTPLVSLELTRESYPAWIDSTQR